jgi:hypothetical protein
MPQGRYIAEPDAAQLDEVLGQWRSMAPRAGVLALLPEGSREAVVLLQDAARRHDLPLFGAIFPALVTSSGFARSGVVLLCLDPCPPWILMDDLAGQEKSAGMARITDFIENQWQPGQPSARPPTLFLVFDGLLPNIATILYHVYTSLGRAVRYAGVNAGSETFQSMPCLFDHERCMANAALAMLMPADTRFAVGHGYPVTAPVFQATSTTDNRIASIDGRPALDVYRELVKAEFGIDITRDNFYEYAVHYPFGVVNALNVLVRIPVGLTEDGAIHCVGEIPPNSVLRLLHAPELDTSACVPDLSDALGRTPDNAAEPMLSFYCAGRRMHFGAESEAELKALQAACHAPTILGALTLGEIGTDPDIGLPEFHNAALVCATG